MRSRKTLPGSVVSFLVRPFRSVAFRRHPGFTLVELIVVITILAILATIGFLALSGYSQDAKDSALKANVRSVVSAIASESAITWNSPRYYVNHDTGAALTGAFVYVDDSPVILTGWAWNEEGSNYSAGNPDYAKLKLNADKFKVTLRSLPDVFFEALAAYDPSKTLSVGAVDYSVSVTASGRKRSSSWFQVAGIDPATKVATVMGDYPGISLSGSVSGLVKDPSSTGALVDAESSNVPPPPAIPATRYPGCDTDDVTLANGQTWAMCNVGASNAWTGGVALADCFGSATDCALSKRNTIGSYFQWGRNDDVTPKGTPTATKAFANTLAWGVGHANFITNNTSPYDWKNSPQNDNLWGGSGSTSVSGTFVSQGSPSTMKGPCASGYHVPTQFEWWTAINAINPGLTNTVGWQDDLTLAATLKLPRAGFRYHVNAGYYSQGTIGDYWTSSSSWTNGYYVSLSSTQVYFSGGTYRVSGMSVRCMRD